MDSYLNEVHNVLSDLDLTSDQKYEILSQIKKLSHQYSEMEIRDIFGDPQRFINDYIHYNFKSQHVTNQTEEPIAMVKTTENSDSLSFDTTKDNSQIVVNYDNNENNVTKSTNNNQVVTKPFRIILFWLIILPYKIIGSLLITFSIIFSIIIGLIARTNPDLIIPLITFNIGLIVAFNAILALIYLFREFIVCKIFGGQL